jgi:hypothetical protein
MSQDLGNLRQTLTWETGSDAGSYRMYGFQPKRHRGADAQPTVKAKVTSRTWPVCPRVKPHLGPSAVKTVTGMSMWGADSYGTKARVFFTFAAGPRQRSHSQVRFPRHSRPYLTVTDSGLPQSGWPDSSTYIPARNGIIRTRVSSGAGVTGSEWGGGGFEALTAVTMKGLKRAPGVSNAERWVG